MKLHGKAFIWEQASTNVAHTSVYASLYMCACVCVCEHVVQSITNKPQKLQTSEYSYLKLDYGRSKHWKTKRISTICARFEKKEEKKK